MGSLTRKRISKEVLDPYHPWNTGRVSLRQSAECRVQSAECRVDKVWAVRCMKHTTDIIQAQCGGPNVRVV